MARVRFLHTADWHAGRQLMGRDRTPEIAEALLEVADIARTKEVDAVLVAGDVYDARTPSAEAEAAVYGYFSTMHGSGIPSVVIAGNHDAPRRLDAVAPLLGRLGATVIGEPRSRQDGGLVVIPVRDTELRVAALPFLSERRIIKLEARRDQDDAEMKPRYRDSMRRLLNNLANGFDSRGVNVAMLHGTMEAARLSASEYTFHSTTAYTLGPEILPDGAQYLALGHMHLPQNVQGLGEHQGRYSGSLIQLDFGEQGDDKYVYVMEAEPGRPAETVDIVKIFAGTKLRREALHVSRLEAELSRLRAFDGWLKLALTLDEPMPGLKDRVMRDLPNVISVENTVRGSEPLAVPGDIHSLDLPAEYARYYSETRGTAVPERLGKAFADLHGAALEHDA